MGFFRRSRESSFSSTPVSAGSSRPLYIRPTRKELSALRDTARVSTTPHGKRATAKRRTSGNRAYKEAKAIVTEFRELKPTSLYDFSDIGKTYNSGSHLSRNLRIGL